MKFSPENGIIMKLFSRNREPKVRPLQKFEVQTKHLTLRVVLFVVFLVIGVAALIYGLVGLFRPQPGGWQSVTVQTGEANCADEFSLIYEFGQSELSVKREIAEITDLYGEACVKAYRLFQAEQIFEDTPNLAALNASPNQPLTLDPALVKALRQADSAGRQLYLGPIYPYYRLIFAGEADDQIAEFDAGRNPQMAAFFAEILKFASDPAAVSLEFTGETEVCLRVSEEYLAFAKENEIYTFVDFHWMKNAFISDYLADTLIEAGYTHGALSSFDGFTRNLDDRGTSYSLYLYGREGDSIRTAAVLQYNRPCAAVSLRSVPVSGADDSRYYVREDGSVIFPYMDLRDGLCRASADHLICASPEMGCGELLMKMIPVYIADVLDLSPLGTAGIAAVCCREGKIQQIGDFFTLSDG